MNLLPLTVFLGSCETCPPQTLFQPLYFRPSMHFFPSGHKQQSLRAVTLFPPQGWGHGIHHLLWLNYTSAQLKVKAITGLSLPLWPPSSPFSLLSSSQNFFLLHFQDLTFYSLTTLYNLSLWHPCFLLPVLFVFLSCYFSNFINFLFLLLDSQKCFLLDLKKTLLSCAVWHYFNCRLSKLL